MIELINLSKSFWANGRQKVIIDRLSFRFPGQRSIALLGRNGAGKSTFLQVISGALEPDEGQVVSDGSISWPVGFGGSFHRELTGAQNIRVIARLYGVDTDELVSFVEEFADIGEHFHMPLRSYSSGMRSRLAFGASMGIPFDTYLVDEVTAVGDAKFKRKSKALFHDRMKSSGAFVVSHDMKQIREFCDCGCVLDNGRIIFFDAVSDAISHHRALMK